MSSGKARLLQVPPAQLSVVHSLPSSQSLGVPALQTVSWQLSFTLQASPSLQMTPLVGVNVQPPISSQESLVHALPSTHTLPVTPAQVPPPHTSPLVQNRPSLHVAVLKVWVQPLSSLHASLVHTLLSSHFLPVTPVQTPELHVSWLVQKSPSVQGTPLRPP